MTISESVINWLMTFNPSAYWQMDEIDTDILSASTTSYALAKEPIKQIKRYLSGKAEHTEYYQLTARLDSQLNADRMGNCEWLEILERWVDTQNKAKNFPIVDQGLSVSDISVSSSFYMGKTAEDNSVYSLTIAIKYNS